MVLDLIVAHGFIEGLIWSIRVDLSVVSRFVHIPMSEMTPRGWGVMGDQL